MRHELRTQKVYLKKKTKPAKNLRYDIEVPSIVVGSKDLYGTNGDTVWQDSAKK